MLLVVKPLSTLAPDAELPVHTSVALQRLHDAVPDAHFTVGWLMASLDKRSFGMIMLLLAVVAMAPGISLIAGALLMIPAWQMIAGRSAPVFPRLIADRPLPTRHLAALVQRAVPVLRHLEKVVHPRWPTPFGPTKRLVGVVVVLLDAFVVLTPVPFGSVVPAFAIVLIALAYLEEDGLLLTLAMLVAIAVMMAASAGFWELARGAKWLSGL